MNTDDRMSKERIEVNSELVNINRSVSSIEALYLLSKVPHRICENDLTSVKIVGETKSKTF